METTNLYTPLIRNAIKQYVNRWISNAYDLKYLEDSYEDFHAPGANYLCLFRSHNLTIKLYESPPTDGKPIVACHDHVYDFDTVLLQGRFGNVTYREHDEDERDYDDLIRYKRQFKSKLNGGNGFDEQCKKVALGIVRGVWFDRKYDHYFLFD